MTPRMDPYRVVTRVRVGLLAAVSLVAAAACSLDKSGAGPEGPSGEPDGATDATVTDDSSPVGHPDSAPMDDGGPAPMSDAAQDAAAAPDVSEAGIVCASGLACNGRCIDATDCTSCPGTPLLCAAQRACMKSCSACAGDGGTSPIECFACDATHGNPVGTCQPDDPTSYCLSGNYFGAVAGSTANHCACDRDAAACPGSTQMCVPLGSGSFCITCGEPVPGAATAEACKGGGTCSAASHTCQPGADD
jgi:hypothetical protein